ncbi:MAG: DNA-3-methyladenine glycosylase [Rhodospirillaceae bacterium]|nr:DNA-3-methyladenine glycosylase [Rhodospirillaceae bacterium]|tara:strand:+ start:50 stop:700 length:651 start_codon:yes stop_codon:yes gene_type:complete
MVSIPMADVARTSQQWHRNWNDGCAILAGRDPILRKLIDRYPNEGLEPHGDVFHTLCWAVTGQQISVLAAERIWERVGRLAGEIRPGALAGLTHKELVSCGLTRMKSTYLIELGSRSSKGAAEHDWQGLDDQGLQKALASFRGVGLWTAQMAMIFALGRLDVLPAHDIGMQRTVAENYGIDRSATALRVQAESWRPWRTIAVWYLWRDLDPVPVAY